MYWIRNVIIGALLLLIFQSVSAKPFTGRSKPKTPFATIISRVSFDLHSEASNIDSLNLQVTALQKHLTSEGAFDNINYKDQNRSVWLPAGHLRNILAMSLAYTSAEGQLSGNKTLFKQISTALDFWNKNDLKCPNWWFNEINCPQLLGEILIVLQSGKAQTSQDLQNKLTQKMKRGDMYKQAGANKVDIAIHNLYRALLTSDSTLLNNAIQQCFIPIELTSKEGIQYDYSYFQHGPQLQIAAYGLTLLSVEYKVASYVRNTQWALPKEKALILNTFFKDAFLKTIRGKYGDFNAAGRRLVRKDILDMSLVIDMHALKNLLQNATLVDPADKHIYETVYKKVYQRLAPEFNVAIKSTYFNNGDYFLNNRPTWLFSVRTNSVRTCRTETVNEENLLGRYLSDGATDILRRGDEYYNIFPLWEWDKVPGVTSRDHLTDWPLQSKWPIPKGTTDFVGGVTDAVNGLCVYQLDYDSLQAKKAYFCFENAVVCLGAGIHTLTPDPVTTSVNQSWLRGEVFSSVNQGSKPMPKDSLMNLAFQSPSDWIWHDSIGYLFPMGGMLSVDNRIQKGNWHSINHVYAKTDSTEGHLFKAWLQHGKKPKSSKYAYIILPAIGKEAMMNGPAKNIQILSNTDSIQAVENKTDKEIGVIFYKPGKITCNGMEIEVDNACLLLIKDAGSNNQKAYISDPTQKLTGIIIRVGQKEHNLTLPRDHKAGTTLAF